MISLLKLLLHYTNKKHGLVGAMVKFTEDLLLSYTIV